MALLTGQNVCDEVAFRISHRLAANGSGAGSIINFTNDTLGLICSAGSWVFDQTSSLGTNVTNGIAILSTMDVGKKISVFETSTGAPIVRATQDDYTSSYSGYVGVASATSFNTFRTLVNSGGLTYEGMILLLPPITGTIDVYYHFVPPTLVYGASPTVRWTIPEMDDLLKDWATAKTMKWLGMSGWDLTWADCMGRLAELRRMYTTEREDMGPEDEAKSVRMEKNVVGRV